MPKVVSQGKQLSSERIREAQVKLGVELPEDYKTFLLQMNGIAGPFKHKGNAAVLSVKNAEAEYKIEGEKNSVRALWALIDSYDESDFDEDPESIWISTVIEQTLQLRQQENFPLFLIEIGVTPDGRSVLLSTHPHRPSYIYVADWMEDSIGVLYPNISDEQLLDEMDGQCLAFKSFSRLVSAMKPGDAAEIETKPRVRKAPGLLTRKVRLLEEKDLVRYRPYIKPPGRLVLTEHDGATPELASYFDRKFLLGIQDGRVEEISFESVDGFFMLTNANGFYVFDLGDGRLFIGKSIFLHASDNFDYEARKLQILRFKAGGLLLFDKCSGRIKPSSTNCEMKMSWKAYEQIPEMCFLRGKLSDIKSLLSAFDGREDESIFDKTEYASGATEPKPFF